MRWLLLCALAASACSVLTQFDPESQPCDLNAPVSQQCLTGFHCVDGLCKKGDALDGGVDAGP
jgi:hypothetical protein